jgi:hypothetical protein
LKTENRQTVLLPSANTGIQALYCKDWLEDEPKCFHQKEISKFGIAVNT